MTQIDPTTQPQPSPQAMSEREFRAIEEWAPDTLKTRPSGYLRNQTQTRNQTQSQFQSQSQGTVNSTNSHGTINANVNTNSNSIPTGSRAAQTTNRRRGRNKGRNRTSSIFEEWRAQASMENGHKGDGNGAQKVMSSNENGFTGAGATTVAAAAGPSGRTATSASTAGRPVGHPVAGQPISAPVFPSAAGTKGRSYRGRPRNDSHARQGSGATEGGQKKIVSGKDSTATPAGPSAGFSGSTTGSSEAQHVSPVADTRGAKRQPGRDGEVAHARQGSKSSEVSQKVATNNDSTAPAGRSDITSDTRPDASTTGSSKVQHAASASATDTGVAKGRSQPEDSNARQGYETAQKNATVSTSPSVDAAEGRHTATKGESSKVAIEESDVAPVGPSAGSSNAADMTTGPSAGQNTTSDKTEVTKGRLQLGRDEKDSPARQGSGPSSTKRELSKASKDSTTAPAGPSVDSSKTTASSTANDRSATAFGSRSRRGGKKNSLRRGKSGLASTDSESKNVTSSTAPPAETSSIDSIAAELEQQPVIVCGSQSQTVKSKKNRHSRQKSASFSAGEPGKAVESKDSKEPSAKRSSAPVASTACPEDKTVISSHSPRADAQNSQTCGVTLSGSAGESKDDKDSSAKSKDSSVKPSNDQTTSVVSASRRQANSVGSHLQSETGEEDFHTRQVSVSAFVEEWKESTAVYEESPVKPLGSPVASTEDQHAAVSSPHPETSEEDFHDCQVSVVSTEESKEAVSGKTATTISEEPPIESSGTPVAPIAGSSESQPAAVSSCSLPEGDPKDSHVHQKAESTPTESEPNMTESINGGTNAGVLTPGGSSVDQHESKPTVTVHSDDVKNHAQAKDKKDTHSRQRSSESASAQTPENKPSQAIPKGPKTDANRRVSTTVNKRSDKRAVSGQNEQDGYTAPNGTFINRNLLARLAEGVKSPYRDTVYFQTSFIEDPWAGMKPVRLECSRR